ncbi:unnamed protein product [Kuraishia capsulata CBS 1993]|uniref:NADH:flavin oxidoreductase/NADH oxidase N-terminal domain-containing protein n=1 Tax=Kuraishia capsulata CBS 1993 TaxID=1382522 RepID=W6MP48_9ASCO|nr:uncharacterized protein KUCA_T00004008001 [Kuraishia capsulata CBS 1993]CDK28028.1 unnamed protein product [Kuraishia capsulata CBS 1993]
MPEESPLSKPFQLGNISLAHRVALAPMTRMRGIKQSGHHIPGDLVVEYYRQRSSEGGLLISEGCPISAAGDGFPGSPGIYTYEQAVAWRRVTDAVHKEGGKVYCQLYHVGRGTVAQIIGGIQPISAVSTPIRGHSFVPGISFSDAPPRAMIGPDFNEVLQQFVASAKLAIDVANFDGVEVHGANGYLLDQFFHDNVNTRNDEYGGKRIEDRARFPLQVLTAVIAAIGGGKTGFRLSPYNTFQDTEDSDPNSHWTYICQQIANLEETVSYVHMIEPRFNGNVEENENNRFSKSLERSLVPFRDILKTRGIAFIAAGGYSKEDATQKVSAGEADIVAFGRYFISNPDLVERLARNLPLSKYDRSSFYGAESPEIGYTDYPFFEEPGSSK